MSKARDLANAGTALTTVSATELGYLDGVTSAVQTQVDAKIAKTLTTTTGDIIYASSANTPARLGIGSTDQVLKVTGGVPAWATPSSGGGLTLLLTTTLSGSTVTISSISQSYKNLKLYVKGAYSSSGSNSYYIRLNGDSGTKYTYAGIRNINTTVTGNNGLNLTSHPIIASVNNTTTYSELSDAYVLIPRYTDTDVINIHVESYCYQGGQTFFSNSGIYDCTAAVTSITILQDTGTFSGGTAYLYGES